MNENIIDVETIYRQERQRWLKEEAPHKSVWDVIADSEFILIYRAVFNRYLQQGIIEKEARQRAFSEVKGYIGKGVRPPCPLSSCCLLRADRADNKRTDTEKVSKAGLRHTLRQTLS